MDFITQHPSNDHFPQYFDFTIRSSVTLGDITSSSSINPNGAFLTALKDKENKYLPLFATYNHPGFIFQVLAFNSDGISHQHVYDLFLSYRTRLTFAFHTSLLSTPLIFSPKQFEESLFQLTLAPQRLSNA
jgi:hypothetical protein